MSFSAPSHLASGFQDPVFDSQHAFRAAMDALANPGRILSAGRGLHGVPLSSAAAALVLALCDYETPLFLAPALADKAGIADYLRFHTDAMLVAEPAGAAFALVDLSFNIFDLSVFAQGTPEYPDRSATVIAMTSSLTKGPALQLTGPGIDRQASLHIAGLPDDFSDQWRINRARFPLGVDIVFAAADSIVGLPRSARIVGEGH
jgi:alpha-D-ribose 1-methylphosphonate 5-triphosphate synthase subunit PhnH